MLSTVTEENHDGNNIESSRLCIDENDLYQQNSRREPPQQLSLPNTIMTGHNHNDDDDNEKELFCGVVFGRSVRMSFCSVHVARIRSINSEYRSPSERLSNKVPTKEARDGKHTNAEDDDDDDDDIDSYGSENSDEQKQKAVALIRIQFMANNPTELRSYCRRFVKNGDLLSVSIPKLNKNPSNDSVPVMWQRFTNTDHANNTEENDSLPPSTVWNAPRLVVNVDNVEQVSTMVRVERRNFWTMRQYQEWQRTYLISIPTISTKRSSSNLSRSIENTNISADLNDQATTNDRATSHHGCGLHKRAQGEFVANFLLHMIARKILQLEGDDDSSVNLNDTSKWALQDLQSVSSQQLFRRVVEILNTGSGVYDVAGGSGHVSMALGLVGVSSTVVDPREKAGKLPKRDRKMFQKSVKRKLQPVPVPVLDPSTTNDDVGTSSNANIDKDVPSQLYCQPVAVQFETLRAWFGIPPEGVDTSYRHPDQKEISVLDDARIQKCSAIVALHPDEATDAIVDNAVRLRIPFVVVPCCVFNRLFPQRRMPNRPDVPVSTHQDLLEYLQCKDASIQKATLPCEGSNTILWSHF